MATSAPASTAGSFIRHSRRSGQSMMIATAGASWMRSRQTSPNRRPAANNRRREAVA
jgi:hypothetical protein